jgi:transposase
MVTHRINVFSCHANFLNGKKCVFCGSFKTSRTARGYIKCAKCNMQKSLKKLRFEISALQGFYRQQPAYRLATDLGCDIKSVTRIYQRIRTIIYHTCELEGCRLSGEIEMDESYFGGRRKGKRGRGAAGKSIVFGLLERHGKHHQVNHSKSLVDKKTKNHINGIEGFWSYAKHILYNYRGVSKYHFPMYLKEVEYRYNHRSENVYKKLIGLYYQTE